MLFDSNQRYFVGCPVVFGNAESSIHFNIFFESEEKESEIVELSY